MNPSEILQLPQGLAHARQSWREWDAPAGDALAHPSAFTERVTWEESTNFFGATITGAGVFECARIQLGATEVLVLEELATFLRAAQDQTVVITLAGQDPSIGSATNGQSALFWRWHCRWDNQEEPVNFLTNGTPGDLPAGKIDGISSTWIDQRYQWGERYTQFKGIRQGGAGFLRLFIEFDIQGDPWSVRYGGRLGGYRQLAGPLRATLETVVKR